MGRVRVWGQLKQGGGRERGQVPPPKKKKKKKKKKKLSSAVLRRTIAALKGSLAGRWPHNRGGVGVGQRQCAVGVGRCGLP